MERGSALHPERRQVAQATGSESAGPSQGARINTRTSASEGSPRARARRRPGKAQQKAQHASGPKRHSAAPGGTPSATQGVPQAVASAAQTTEKQGESGDSSGEKGDAPRRIRTCNLRFRRPMLYPVELAALRSSSQSTRSGRLRHARERIRSSARRTCAGSGPHTARDRNRTCTRYNPH